MRQRGEDDAALSAVTCEIQNLDPEGRRTAQVLRNTFDQLYDGQRTRRYHWDQLHNTERKHFGPQVEINLHREFKFMDGDMFNYRITGVDVDCKYTQTLNMWMIPPEADGHLCLLLWADDAKSKWSLGIVRITPERLNTGVNRDGKANLNPAGRHAITWLFDHAPLPSNILLHLDRQTVDRIMALGSGQKRINEIFRAALGMPVGRAVVATLGEQLDPMKRVRYNGGARTKLQPEGIIILGECGAHVAIARALGVAEPGPSEFISVRGAPAAAPGPGVAEISDGFWRVAQSSDPVVFAPRLSEPKASS